MIKKLISCLFIMFVLSGCRAKLSQHAAETLVMKEKAIILVNQGLLKQKKQRIFIWFNGKIKKTKVKV